MNSNMKRWVGNSVKALALGVVLGLVGTASAWQRHSLTCTAGSEGRTEYNEGPSSAFDENFNSKWLNISGAAYVEFCVNSSTYLPVGLLQLVAANDTSTYTGRNWKNWTLKGWNGSSWDTVKSWENQYPSTTHGTTSDYTFTLPTGKVYGKYRIDVTGVQGSSSGGYQQMAEIRLYAYDTPAAPAVELITNGSFENGTALSDNSYKYHDSTCKTDSWVGGSGRQRGRSTWACGPYLGSYVLWFQSAANVAQMVDFPVAGTYRLSFAYTGRWGSMGYLPHNRDVKLGAKQLLAYTVSDQAWHPATVDFVVTAPGPQLLSFNWTTGTGDKASAIDAVSCYLVTPAETVTDCSDWRSVRAVLAAGGNARLVKDVRVTSTAVCAAGKTQFIDLNGHTATMDNAASRAFLLNNCNLTLKGEGAFDGNGVTCTYAGQLAYLGNTSTATLTIEDGVTVRNMNAGTNNGGAIYVQQGSFTMKGGTITNCVAKPSGGAIYLAAGTLNLKGGVIADCRASNCGGGVRATGGTINLSGTKILRCKALSNGNGIQMDGTSTFNMTGGEVCGCSDIEGTTQVYGGALLFWNNVTANIYGGVIANNTSAGGGGAITFGAISSLNIYGGVFSNNVGTAGYNLVWRQTGSKTATILGGFFDVNPSSQCLGTTVNLYSEAANGYVVGNPAAANADGELTGGFYTFCPTNELYAGVGLGVAPDATLTGAGTSWTVTSTNVVECSTWMQMRGNLMRGNSVKLVADIEQNASCPSIGTTGTTTLDLNGHTITQIGLRRMIYDVGTKFTITDSSEEETGAIVGDGSTGYMWGRVARYTSGEIVFEKGTIRGFDGSWNNGSEVGNTAVFSLYVSAKLTMNGGTIRDCKGNVGPAAYIESGTTFTMNGGVIENCASTTTTDYSGGGAIYLAGGTFTMNGGEIRNNTSVKSAGAICGVKGATININDGTISGNVSGQGGGAYYGGATMTIRGGRIINNRASSDGALSYSGPLTIYGGTITNNTATSRNMTINACQNSGTIYASTIYGGVIDGYIGWDQGVSGTSINIYGGLFAKDPATTITGFNRGAPTVKNTKVLRADGWYLVGATPASDKNGIMTGGTYTFCPTNAEYAAAGISLGGDTTLSGSGTSWSVASTNAVEVSDWLQMKYNLEAGNSVKVMNDIQATAAHIFPHATKNVTIDLNGYEVTQSLYDYMFELSTAGTGTMTIMDSSAAGTGAFVGNGTTTGGDGGNWVRLASSGRGVILESGTIRNFTLNNTYGGGAIKVFSGTTFTMNGGTISNCVSSGSSTGGGAVYVAPGGRFEQKGGLITGCRSAAWGGAVAVPNVSSSGGTYVLSGGALVGNTSGTFGGGVFIGQYGTMTFTDGIISNNTANGTTAGGGICSSGKVTMKGGLLVDNKAPNQSTATAFYSNIDDSDAIYGGVIEGTIYREQTADFYIYGGVFDRNPSSLCASGYTCSQVSDGYYAVGVNVVQDAAKAFLGGQFTFPLTNELYATRGVSIAAGSSVSNYGTSWAVGGGAAVACSTWQEVATAALQGRNIKLTASFTQTSSPISTCYLGQNQQVTLDLNGFTITKATGLWLFAVSSNGAKLTIEDSAGGGKIVNVSGGTVGADGGCFNVPNGELVLNGGTLSGFKTTKSGGCVYVNTGAKFTMNGGKITGCTSAGQGGAVYVSSGSRFEMYGGEISANTVTGSDAGTGCGGGIRNAGTTIIYGGRIASNSASRYAGGIYNNGGALEIRGGTLTGNSAPSGKGGAIDCDAGKVTFYGGVVTGNTGGNFLIENANGMTVCGGVFDANPASVANTALGAGCVSRLVGTKYIVGKGELAFPIAGTPTLVNGEYTFCPTNAEYVAAGVVLDTTGSTFDAGEGVWTLTAPKPIAVTAWAQLKATLEAGFDARLMADMNADSEIGIASGYDLTIDMNGKTVTRTASTRLFNYTKAQIRLTDSVGGGRFTAGTSTYPYRASFALLGGGNSTFVLDGDVTIDGFKAGGSSGEGQGGAFSLESAASLIISNGVIRSCSANTDGGAVYAKSGATITMAGGMITNCAAAASGGAIWNGGTVTIDGGVIAGCSTTWATEDYAKGGGALYNAGTATINGGTFVGNKALGKACGGVFYCASGKTITINDGLFTDNSCELCGTIAYAGTLVINGGEFAGNHGAYDTFQDILKIYGGSIHDNTNTTRSGILLGSGSLIAGGCIAGDSFTGTTSGTVTGGVFDRDQSACCAGGYVCRKVGSNWVVGKGVDANAAGALTRGIYTFGPTNALYAAAGLAVDLANATLAYTNATWCLTSNDGAPVNVSDWMQLRSALEAGYSVKLTNDIAQTSIGQFSLSQGQDVTLDLNGHTITRYVAHWFGVVSGAGTVLRIADTSDGKTGTVAGVAGSGHSADGSMLNITGGTVIIDGGTFKDLYTSQGGGWAYVASGAKLVINGGTVTNCKCGTYGGGVYVNGGTVEMYGGTIEKCTGGTSGGGAFRCLGSSVLKIYGGNILNNNGNTYGGVCIASQASQIYFYGGYYKGNYATNGDFYVRDSWGSGNGYLFGGVLDGYDPSYKHSDESAQCLTLQSGMMVQSAGTCFVVGKNVAANGTTLTGGVFTFNPTNAEYAAVSVADPSQLVANGGDPATWTLAAKRYCLRCGKPDCEEAGEGHEIREWFPWTASTMPSGSGNYYLSGDVQLTAQYQPANGLALDLAGHTVTQKTANARVVNIPANVTFTLTDSVGGGKLTGGNLPSDYGAGVNINAANAKFIMYGGSICGNTAKSAAGIRADNTCTINIYGGFIENNVAAEYGGGLCLSTGTHEIRNCVIRNNQATAKNGGAARFDNATVAFIDCVITNNAAAAHGGISASNSYATKIALGGRTVLKDNHVVGQTEQNNLGIESGRLYSISTLVPLADGAEIGVTTDAKTSNIAVTGINTTDYARFFFADDTAYVAINDANTVKLVKTASVVAKIGETPYTSVQYAINSANAGETVTLVKNVGESIYVDPGMDVVLDLNGFALGPNTRWSKTIATIQENGKLTLDDSSANGCLRGAEEHGVTINASGEFVMNGGMITNCTTTASGGGIYNAGTLTINGGTIAKCTAPGTSGCGGAIETAAGSTTTINGGLFRGNSTANYGGAIHAGDTVSVYGGMFADNTATMGMPVFDGTGDNKWFGLYGCVVGNDYDPLELDPTTGTCDCVPMDGAVSTHVGHDYIVGKSIRFNDDGELVRGVTTFCATNAEYVAGGVKIAAACTSAYRPDAKPTGGYIVAKPEDLATHEHCLCGDASCAAAHPAAVAWLPWTLDSALPTDPGDYYLVYDTDLADAYAAGDGVRLCLNGKTVRQTTAGKRVIDVPANRTFALTDCGAGRVTGGSVDTLGGGVLVAGEFDFFGGEIAGNVATNGALALDGGAIVLGGRAVITNNPTGGNLYLASGETVSVSTNVPFVAGAKCDIVPEVWPGKALLVVPVTATHGADHVFFTCGDPRFAAVDREGQVQLWAPVVTYEAWGGTFADGVETVRWSCPDRIYDAPPAFARAGYDFTGWGLSWTNGAAKVQWNETLFTNGDHTVYAHWTSQSVAPGEVDDKIETVDVPGRESEPVTQVMGTPDGKSFPNGEFALPDVTSDDPSGKAIVKIGEKAYRDRNYDGKRPASEALTSVRFPTYVTEIGAYAFQKCTSLTNVTFAPARDYMTGAKAKLYIGQWAFRGSSIREVRFPAGSTVVLAEGAFAYAADLRDIYIDGNVEIEPDASPFSNIGKNLSDGKVRVRLSPTLAADAAYVLALTNGMNAAYVELCQDIEGKCTITASDVESDPMTFTFTVASDSPWLTVNADTVYVFHSTDLTAKKRYIGNDPLYATKVVKNTDGSYTATVPKPAISSSTVFYQLCVGDAR